MIRRFFCCLSAVAIVWSLPFPAMAQTGQLIEQFRLRNGMEVVVLPNHRVAAVNHMLWFKVGAADDPLGQSGLAHFHEHLMFKGSAKFASGEYTKLLDRNGGKHNAFTGHDATSYFVTIPKDKLPLVMELEADRIRGLTVSDADAALEKKVILEERSQRTDNSPEALLNEQMNAALFRNHPYHQPVIGWRHEMEELSKKNVLDFHTRYYHAANAILIVSGDITAKELRPLAEKYYGNLPKRAVLPRLWTQEPPHTAARTVTLHHPHVKQPILTRIYTVSRIKEAGTTKAAARLALSHLLGGGKNSVLYRSLVVEQKIATSVDTDYSIFSRGPASFTIEVVPENNVSLETVEQALNKILDDLVQRAVSDDDLSRSKQMLKADAVYAREGLNDISNIMGWMMMADQPPELFNQWPDIIAQITAEDVAQAARDTFVIEQSVTGYLLPEKGATHE